MSDRPLWRRWLWIGAWLLALAVVAGALMRLALPRSEAAPAQATRGWTPWPTATVASVAVAPMVVEVQPIVEASTTVEAPTVVEASITVEVSSVVEIAPAVVTPEATPAQSATVVAVAATPGPTATPAILGRVVVPSAGIDTDIVAVSWHLGWVQGQQVAVWDVAKDDAGWHRGTAALGEVGNCVLSGHIKGTNEGVFRGLSDVVAGDEVWLYPADGRVLRYVVDEALLLPETGENLVQRQENARYMDPTEDTRLTLITCWPNWAYTHRVVVIARPAEAP